MLGASDTQVTPDHGRRSEGSHFMLAVRIGAADSTGVSEPVQRRVLVLRRLRLRCCRCAAASARPDVQRLRLAEDFIIMTKRQVNGVVREALRDCPDDERIALFCEYGNERCYQAVWLTGPAHDQARAEPEWLALVPGHLAAEDRARAVVSTAAATATHERRGRVIVGAND